MNCLSPETSSGVGDGALRPQSTLQTDPLPPHTSFPPVTLSSSSICTSAAASPSEPRSLLRMAVTRLSMSFRSHETLIFFFAAPREFREGVSRRSQGG